MKLGTLRTGGPDGTLVVVSRDLERALCVPEIALTLQHAIDRWPETAAALDARYAALNRGELGNAFALDPTALAAPLPRAYQFADGSAYLRHVELLRRARGAEVPEQFRSNPLIYQACSDPCLGPRQPVRLARDDWGVDFEAELAAITDFVPMGTGQAAARSHLILFALVNDVSLRGLIADELAKGFGFFQSKPPSTFSPVAVTADEFGDAWDGETVHLELRSTLRGELFGHPTVSVDQTFTLAQLVEHCAKTRDLGAGTIIGSGTVANAGAGVGHSCIAEARAVETLEGGSPKTPYLRFGDRIRIEMLDRAGCSVFGAIDQSLEPCA